MTEILSKCPLCKSEHIETERTVKDYSVSKEEFSLYQCSHCEFLFTNPRPDQTQISRYYQSDQYISHANKSNSPINFIYKLVRNYTLRKKVRLINSLTQGRRLLDFGCGTGHFLAISKKNNWNISGLETDPSARKIAAEKTSVNIYSETNQIVGNQYDIITLWHVLEHVHELRETMIILSGALSESGKMIVAVPNHKSYDAGKYGKYWAAYDVPRHLYHFEKKTMKNLAHQHGLKIVNILPMKFDAYYVSMLSEKYKTDALNPVKIFINSCKSNIYANKSGEYSSLIYVLSK